MKKKFLSFVLLGSLLISFVFGEGVEDRVDQKLLKYGIDDFKSLFYGVQQSLENDLKEISYRAIVLSKSIPIFIFYRKFIDCIFLILK